MDSPHDNIFISYSRANSAFVDHLETELRARGYHAWVDRHDLEGGQTWIEEIQREIDRSLAVVVVLSPPALNSIWVRKEYLYAVGQGKLVVPLLAQQIGTMPLALHDTQAVDFTDSFDSGISKLLRALPRPGQSQSKLQAQGEGVSLGLLGALREFAEGVEDPARADVLSRPIELLSGGIEKEVFSGHSVHVGVALKRRRDGRIVLSDWDTHATVGYGGAQSPPYLYPDSLAAWSLILGECLVDPMDRDAAETPVNYAWLRLSNKLDMVSTLLTQLTLDGSNGVRATLMLKQLRAGTLTLGDIAQQSDPSDRFGRTVFVAIPLRPSPPLPGNVRAREIGVLHVTVTAAEQAPSSAIFTRERLNTLCLISTALQLMLTTADTLRRPEGVWRHV